MKDVMSNDIGDIVHRAFKKATGHKTNMSEIRSWENSMQYMYRVLEDDEISQNTEIAIEYHIPQSSKRIDFIIAGKNAKRQDAAILIELKQWSEATLTDKDGIVVSYVGRAEREVSHPSYQAWTYACLLEDFNQTVQEEHIKLHPCAYLHNYDQDDVITNEFYKDYTDKAPVFLKPDALKLREFIKANVKYGDKDQVMYRIDHGKIKPSKNLADKLDSMLQDNQEFLMIDDQKVVYETALKLAKQSTADNKNVLIVQGGPGTGKSVVAINLLVELTKKQLLTKYITRNAAPRDVYESKLTKSFRKSHISNLFSGSGSFTETQPNLFDALIVDEAHRLNAKSGMYQNKGENQIKEIIQSAKFSIFFLDEDQKVTLKDIGESEEIKMWAFQLGAKTQELVLESQFRCNGSDGYLAWLDNTLQIHETANETLAGIDYDFKVIDNPNELRDLIFEKNKIANKARLVAGYCWKWQSKNDRTGQIEDVIIDEYDFAMRWNLASDGNLWILKPDAVNEIGCIHTCQGLEMDYVGVIIGPDLIVRNGKIITDATKRAGSDKSVYGYKKMHAYDPAAAEALADRIIKNTYRTLMTRGQKGCYVYCTDIETRDYFKAEIKGNSNA
ncbi:MAG TPA: DUF2075 domain-containing protein [Rhabdochlamydiaceae bacterium]